MDYETGIEKLEELLATFSDEHVGKEIALSDEIYAKQSQLLSNMKQQKTELRNSMHSIQHSQQSVTNLLNSNAITELDQQLNSLQSEKENICEHLKETQRSMNLENSKLLELKQNEKAIESEKTLAKNAYNVDIPRIKHQMKFFEHLIKIDWDSTCFETLKPPTNKHNNKHKHKHKHKHDIQKDATDNMTASANENNAHNLKMDEDDDHKHGDAGADVAVVVNAVADEDRATAPSKAAEEDDDDDAEAVAHRLSGYMYLPTMRKIERFDFAVDPKNEAWHGMHAVENMWQIMDQEIEGEMNEIKLLYEQQRHTQAQQL